MWEVTSLGSSCCLGTETDLIFSGLCFEQTVLQGFFNVCMYTHLYVHAYMCTSSFFNIYIIYIYIIHFYIYLYRHQNVHTESEAENPTCVGVKVMVPNSCISKTSAYAWALQCKYSFRTETLKLNIMFSAQKLSAKEMWTDAGGRNGGTSQVLL